MEPRLARIASAAQFRWPQVERLALLHRVGRLKVGEVSVVVAASTPHRAEAFEATWFCIDTVKESVPIWERESWADGTGWALCPHDLVQVDADGGRSGDSSRSGTART